MSANFKYYAGRFVAIAGLLILILVINANEKYHDEQLKLYGVNVDGIVVELKSESRLFKLDLNHAVVAYEFKGTTYHINIPNPDKQIWIKEKFIVLCSSKESGITKVVVE